MKLPVEAGGYAGLEAGEQHPVVRHHRGPDVGLEVIAPAPEMLWSEGQSAACHAARTGLPASRWPAPPGHQGRAAALGEEALDQRQIVAEPGASARAFFSGPGLANSLDRVLSGSIHNESICGVLNPIPAALRWPVAF
ncbi:MAG TPA: hypothetical protein VMS01_16025, partial [Stellaceae bacterium]|nr:hypothetical protein [Stellaceae bacterium]